MNFSQGFFENAILLVVTAVLTGFVVPYVLKRIDEQRLREQQIVEAQTHLLDNLARLLWDFQLRVIAVTYYKISGKGTEFQSALNEYESQFWDSFGKIRIEISTARRFTTQETHTELLTFYQEWLMPVDASLMKLVQHEAPLEAWSDFHNDFKSRAGAATDRIINRLADEFGLSTHTRHSRRQVVSSEQ